MFCLCFCFFKQKTAYEMRISDWSSDVCSSDLFAIDRKRLAAQQICDDLRERILGLELKPGTGLSRPALTEFYRVSQTPIRDAIQIGRASCRERVCQSV